MRRCYGCPMEYSQIIQQVLLSELEKSGKGELGMRIPSGRAFMREGS